MTLPTLYKQTKTGAIQSYQVETTNELITVTQGQVDGKKQSYPTICTGKNIGKANETTPTQQAELEAKAKWQKKLDSGYTTDPSGEIQIQLPQKVKAYIGNEHKIKFPAISTPKLNGINGTYWLLPDGSLKLTSRGGLAYPAIPHLEPEIKILMKELKTTCLNGELYIHGQHLQDITSAVKKPKALSKDLEFSIFEAPLIAPTYKERRTLITEAMEGHTFQSIAFLTGVEVTSAKEIETHYNQCMQCGLEGTVIYNLDAPYEFNTRSSYVYKYKKTLDAEYEIADCEVDKNGHPVLHCLTKDGKLFKVKPKGTDAERKAIVATFETTHLGKHYKIEYETLSKDGIPLKPVGICLRECDTNGNPKE